MISSHLPRVGVIDMENRDGTIYTPSSAAEQIEKHELEGVAEVIYTGASSIEMVDRDLAASFSAVMLRRCAFGQAQLERCSSVKHVRSSKGRI